MCSKGSVSGGVVGAASLKFLGGGVGVEGRWVPAKKCQIF